MNRFFFVILLIFISTLSAKTFTVSTSAELYDVVSKPLTELEIYLKPGIYDLTPIPVIDSTLGNALNPDSMITVTTGLHLVGKSIKLIGKNRRKTIIKTHSGYGIFIEHCHNVLIKNLTITDGTRDQDGNATSGAIVVKHSHTKITGCIIENNQGDFSKTIAGIIGICGREGSILGVEYNIIRDNSWDGIALYRKSRAFIENNLIFNGRGAGIGITWDSNATVKNNVIHHYWKGIGTFGTSKATVSCNLVRDIRGWGIIASGNSEMSCNYNEVRRSGNVGIAVWDSTATMNSITGNVICLCGQEKQWIAPLVGIWINSPDSVAIIKNLFWGNKHADIAYGYKEPGPDGSSFSFSYSQERFNNNKIYSTESLDKLNYYKSNQIEQRFNHDACSSFFPAPYSSLLEFGFDLLHVSRGIFLGGDWTWDPDGEPFVN